MAIHAHDTVIKIGDSTGGTTAGWNSDPSSGFTAIAEIRDSEGPSMTRDDIEVTYHNAPGGRRQYISDLLELGEVTFPVNWLPTDSTHDSTDGLLADLKNKVDDRDFVIVLSDAANTPIYFTGYVKGFEPGHPVSGELTASITIKVNGNDIVYP